MSQSSESKLGKNQVFRRTITVRGNDEKEVTDFIAKLARKFEYSKNWQGDIVIFLEDQEGMTV